MAYTVSKNLYKRKKIVLLSLVAILLVAFSLAIVFTLVYAGSDVEADASSATSLMKDAPDELLNQLNGSTFYEIFGISESVSDVCFELAGSIGKAISGIAAFLVFLLTIYSVIKDVVAGDTSLDMWLKIFIKLVISLGLIICTTEVLAAIRDVGSYLVNLTAGAIEDISSSNAFEWGDAANRNAILESSNYSFACRFLALILSLYTKIISYSLILEMALRTAFAPIATASIVVDGLRSPGIRFLKKYFVIFVKMALILVVIKFGCILVASIGEEADQALALLSTFFILTACTSFIGKGSTIADQIVGS